MICKRCSEEKEIYAKGLCRNCYQYEQRRSKGNACADCGVLILNTSIRCGSCARKGKNNPNYKGGRRRDKRGYILIHDPEHPRADSSGYVFEHILVAQKTLGHEIPPGYVVHHLDGNPGNNAPLNLSIMGNKTHLDLHRTGHL